jgi:hypothetical protein
MSGRFSCDARHSASFASRTRHKLGDFGRNAPHRVVLNFPYRAQPVENVLVPSLALMRRDVASSE